MRTTGRAVYLVRFENHSILEYAKLTAPPNGFAREATAVADTLPFSVNHISLYLVGAARTNGWPKPIKTCPVMTTANCPVLAPIYRTQLPERISMLAANMAGFGPLLRT